MKTTRTDLDLLADKLRKCYQFERNQLARCQCRPDNYRVPKFWQGSGREGKGQSVFHKLAMFCQRQNIDPIHYIQWCLHPSQIGLGRPCEPNQLLSQQKVDAYRESQPRLRQAIVSRLKRERDYAQCDWHMQRIDSTPENAWTRVLLNSHLEVSPLFRYCIARSLDMERFDKIARTCESDALLQYQRDPKVYGACWIRKMLPADFAEQAGTQYYDQLLAQEP